MLRWILRLRWVAAFGQLFAMLAAAFVFHLELPWVPMISGLMLTVFSNHLLQDCMDGSNGKCRPLINTLIFGDSLILTTMLYFSGGVHNPFTGFYLLLIALAAMTLSGRSLCVLLVLVAVEVLVLSIWHLPFSGPAGVVGGRTLTYPVFLAGWGVSLLLIAVCIAFFVHRMNRQLREREKELAEAERQITEANRFQSLATLAAGVAHELGSPLGTIAIASKELERSLRRDGASAGWQEDARLIRSEVERCRQILDRLDRRSTRGTGESPEACTAASLCARLEKHLSSEMLERVKTDDRTQNFPLLLSTGAVLQSLVVLIENACEADPSGRPVTLDIRIHEQDEIVFRVLDQGPGIPDHLRRRIGEPFFTTKKDTSGMGLGIFLIQTLTAHLGGSCTLLPAVDGGTCATLSLPVKPKDSPE
jgi:two-component system sensor histidine kinase RegB